MDKRIRNIKDLTDFDVINSNISNILFAENIGDKEPQWIFLPVSREDYILCYSRCNEIVNEIKQNYHFKNEKELFAIIYMYVANMNDTVISDNDALNNLQSYVKGKNYEQISRIQGFYNMLYGGITTCHSRAFMLSNLCSLFNIDAAIINGTHKGNGVNHSWNVVKLDGQWYETDLQWDLKSILKDEFPLNEFLKSHKDFKHDMFYTSMRSELEKSCDKSISKIEQYFLFRNYNAQQSKNDILKNI